MAQPERHTADEADLDHDERPDEPRGADEDEFDGEFDEEDLDDEDLDDEDIRSGDTRPSFPDRRQGPGD